MKLTRQVHLLIYGPQGSGKGTQAQLLEKQLGIKHISSGQVLRSIAKTKTPLGKYLQKQLPTGQLTPIAKMLQVFDMYMKKAPKSLSIIFDGFARQITETRLFLKRLKRMSRLLDLIILVKISEKESVRRLSMRGYCEKCGRIYILKGKIKIGSKCKVCKGKITQRADDEPSAIRRRLKLYNKRTVPVVNFFAYQGKD